MCQGDEDVGVHYGVADFGLLYIFAAVDRDGDVVSALESVGDDHRAAGGERSEAVLPGAVQVLDRVLAASGIKSVAVGKEGFPSELPYDVDHGSRVVGAQESHVPELSEMHLYGHELAVHVDISDAGGPDEPLELVRRALVRPAAEISEIDFRHNHVS